MDDSRHDTMQPETESIASIHDSSTSDEDSGDSTYRPLAIQHGVVPERLDEAFEGILGRPEALGSDESERALLVAFLQQCWALVHAATSGEGLYRATITAVVDVYGSIVEEQPGNSLTALIVMAVLMSAYGHNAFIGNVLDAVQSSLLRFREREVSKVDIVATLEGAVYIIRVLQSSQIRYFDHNAALVEMEIQGSKHFGDRSPSEVSARYLVAWALLESGGHREAVEILAAGQNLCRSTIGIDHIQSLIWTATLARGYAMAGDFRQAAQTHQEAAKRIQACFPETHPYHWESRYRQAMYDIRTLEQEQKMMLELPVGRPGLSPETCTSPERAAMRLREVLKWRVYFLGSASPQTLQVSRALRRLLVKMQLATRDATLREILELTIPNEPEPEPEVQGVPNAPQAGTKRAIDGSSKRSYSAMETENASLAESPLLSQFTIDRRDADPNNVLAALHTTSARTSPESAEVIQTLPSLTTALGGEASSFEPPLSLRPAMSPPRISSKAHTLWNSR